MELIVRWRITRAVSLVMAYLLTTAAIVYAHDSKIKGQEVYVPVYSSIGYVSSLNFDLAVTLSFRNLDQDSSINIKSAIYFNTAGKKIKDLLEENRKLAPFETTQILIKNTDFRGDIGGNIVVVWNADVPVVAPLLEAIMVGSRGTQAFSFTSRGVILDEHK